MSDAVRSDQCPTEPVIVKEKPKLVKETCLTNEKKHLSAEDMANPALLPGLLYRFNGSVGVC